MMIVLDWHLSPSDVVKSNDISFLVIEATLSFLNLIEWYLPSSQRTTCLNSFGFVPSLVINPLGFVCNGISRFVIVK
jgi:hypothetical protein